MSDIYKLSKDFQSGLVDLYKSSGFDALCREMSERIEKHKGVILTTWFAQHGFAPGKAVLVEERLGLEFRTYIRECTAEEAERARTSTNSSSLPCLCPHCSSRDVFQSVPNRKVFGCWQCKKTWFA